MPPYYVIVDVQIDDPEEYKKYMIKAKPAAEKFGGEYLVRGGEFNVIEGNSFSPRRLVLVKFPNKEACDNFYNSPEYQEARAIRLPVSDMVMVGVEGA